jgi:transcriptional regulator with GAF, ATPase, and Fis domain
MAPPARLRLSGLERVAIGGGEGPRAFDAAACAIRLADRYASQHHATLALEGERWVLQDEASVNRTWVNGHAVQRTVLHDGDRIELGRTVCTFGMVPASAASGERWLDAETDPWPARGLETILPELAHAYERLARVAASSLSLVILGETGTGKELIAEAVHRMSGRPGPFVALNCGALSPSLLEAELFGHKKGTFSGATASRLGWVRSAAYGTLFLDEIGDLPLPAQAAFLRVLQQKEVVPVGDHRPVAVDFRLCAATHRDLDTMIARGEFRRDLYMRLQGYVFTVPALRRRRPDIGLLIGLLLRRMGAVRGETSIGAGALAALLSHDWPGNIRELEKCLESAHTLAGGGKIELEHLPEGLRGAPRAGVAIDDDRSPAPPTASPRVRRDDDARLREELAALLREHAWNISAVARATRKTRFQVRRWIKRFGFDITKVRDGDATT